MSGTINYGGSEFPCGPTVFSMSGDDCSRPGMTLRDYFAAKSLPIAWAAYDQGYTGQPECVEQSIAHHAYQIADAMLRARESK